MRNFILSPVYFDMTKGGTVVFDMKAFWQESNPGEIDILRLNSQTVNGDHQTVILKKINTRNINFLVGSITSNSGEQRLAVAAGNLADRAWHKIVLSFSKNKFALTIDGAIHEQATTTDFNVTNITGITFYPFNGAIDNLEIKSQDQTLFQQNFD